MVVPLSGADSRGAMDIHRQVVADSGHTVRLAIVRPVLWTIMLSAALLRAVVLPAVMLRAAFLLPFILRSTQRYVIRWCFMERPLRPHGDFSVRRKLGSVEGAG